MEGEAQSTCSQRTHGRSRRTTTLRITTQETVVEGTSGRLRALEAWTVKDSSAQSLGRLN